MPETSHKNQKPVTKTRNQSQKPETTDKRSGTFAEHSPHIRRRPRPKAHQGKKGI